MLDALHFLSSSPHLQVPVRVVKVAKPVVRKFHVYRCGDSWRTRLPCLPPCLPPCCLPNGRLRACLPPSAYPLGRLPACPPASALITLPTHYHPTTTLPAGPNRKERAPKALLAHNC